MKRFIKEKLKISDCPSSIVIESFKCGLLRNSDLFIKLTNIVPQKLEETYRKVRKFVKLERESGLDKSIKVVVEVVPKKEKRRRSPNRKKGLTKTRASFQIIG